ncbi:MAG TPA: NAD(P)H-binding protein [Polyangiaceae bacterium]|nr:NAD(P)H-binding protein [Polyangiaceae bacterium]
MASIVVYGAGGKAGSRIVAEAASRGHSVLAVVRDPTRLRDLPAGVRTAAGEATSTASLGERARGSDALVFAIGGADKSVYARAARAAVEVLTPLGKEGPRLLHMGGGGSLLNAQGGRFADAPGLPPALVEEMKAQAAALEIYRKSTGVRWTYVSPPPGIFAPGIRTGHYRTGLEHPVVAADGSMRLSYEDFAVAIVDEIENGKFIGMRFTVGY